MPEQPRQEDIDELMKVLGASDVPPTPEPARKDPAPRPSAAPVAYPSLAGGGPPSGASAW